MQKPYLNIDELSALFGMKKTSLLNSISDERFCCPTYRLGSQRVADRQVVEAYFEARRSEGLDQLTSLS